MGNAKVIVPVKIGDQAVFSKTISESDVYNFGGIIGDFSPMHFNEEHAKHTPYRHRIAHGVLTFAFASTVSTILQDASALENPSVSYGYEKVRFINPVYFGDTLRAIYTVTDIDEAQSKSYGKVEIYNQHEEIVCACTHILKFFAKS